MQSLYVQRLSNYFLSLILIHSHYIVVSHSHKAIISNYCNLTDFGREYASCDYVGIILIGVCFMIHCISKIVLGYYLRYLYNIKILNEIHKKVLILGD